jgi:hypothetical protein
MAPPISPAGWPWRLAAGGKREIILLELHDRHNAQQLHVGGISHLTRSTGWALGDLPVYRGTLPEVLATRCRYSS